MSEPENLRWSFRKRGRKKLVKATRKEYPQDRNAGRTSSRKERF
jgi:hypothetical protein